MKDPIKKLSNELTLESAKKRLGILAEFKQFAMRGNVVDLAVGVVIGAAFGKIVTSMVSDIITPVIGVISPGGSDLKNKFISLEPAKTVGIKVLADAQKAGSVIAYGQFLTDVMDFVIVAFCIFLLVKLMNRLNMASAAIAAPPEPTPSGKAAHRNPGHLEGSQLAAYSLTSVAECKARSQSHATYRALHTVETPHFPHKLLERLADSRMALLML